MFSSSSDNLYLMFMDSKIISNMFSLHLFYFHRFFEIFLTQYDNDHLAFRNFVCLTSSHKMIDVRLIVDLKWMLRVYIFTTSSFPPNTLFMRSLFSTLCALHSMLNAKTLHLIILPLWVLYPLARSQVLPFVLAI